MKQAAPDPSTLPMSLLTPSQFLPFLREVERLGVQRCLDPVFVFWSTHSAIRLLPSGARFREFMRDAKTVSIFSEDDMESGDEWCFLLESQGLCISVSGAKTDSENYQCKGTMDSASVRETFKKLKPRWIKLDECEYERLESIRSVDGSSFETSADVATEVIRCWPISFELQRHE